MQRVPSYHSLLVPAFLAIQALGGTASNADIGNWVQKSLGLEDIDKERLLYNLVWARSYLKRYGFINNLKMGIWSIEEPFLDHSAEDIKASIKEAKMAI